MSDEPRIVAFYSFKGGVGRSMAVINLAYSLAAKGQHVLVLDMDLEAPGVSGFLHREKEIQGFAACDMVDLLKWASSAMLPLEPTAYPTRTDFVVSVPAEKVAPGKGAEEEIGHLDIVPVEEERAYYDRLAELNLGSCTQEDLVRTGSVLRTLLKSIRVPIEVPDYYGPDCERSAPYDYVFVDSRTGITETGGLCIGPLSDQLVVLTALNDQNIQGTRQFLKEVGIIGDSASASASPDASSTDSSQKHYLLVASLVPAGEIETKHERLHRLEVELRKPDAKLSYHPQLALKETIFTRDYRDEYLAGEYEELLKRIRAMSTDGSDKVVRTLSGHPQSPEELREGLEELMRFPFRMELAPLALGPFLAGDFKRMSQDADFVLRDRFCRLLARYEGPFRWNAGPFRWNVVVRWADLLTDWGFRSTDQALASARYEKGLALYEEALREEGVPPVAKAGVLFNRGITYENRGELEKSIDDFTTVAEMAGVTIEQKAEAIVRRGIVYGKQGSLVMELEDYTSVVDMSDAPASQKASALVNRAWAHFLAGRFNESIKDSRQVISLEPKRCLAHGNLALALLISGQTDQAMASYEAANALATKEEREEIIKDLREAIEKHCLLPGAEEVIRRLETPRSP